MPAHVEADHIDAREAPVHDAREIVTILYKKNHRLFQIAFRSPLQVGPLGQVWTALIGMGVKIRHTTMYSTDGNTGIWNVFLDSEDYGLTSKALRSKLESVSILSSLRITQGDELVADQLFFPIVGSTGNRLMILSQVAFQGMLTKMDSVLGTGESVIAYQEGRAIGAAQGEGIMSLVGGDSRKHLGEIAKVLTAMGAGICEIVEMDLDNLHFVLRLRESLECQGKTSEQPRGYWLKGILEGGASALLETPMVCQERKCLAVGDPYCEFELSAS